MSDVVERAKAALEGITGGPWQVELVDGEPVEHQHYQYDSTDEWYDVDGPHGGWLAHCQDVADARFIAAARELVPELVAEVERLDSTLFLIREARIDYDAALRRREHGGAAAQRFVYAVESALDGGDQ